MNPHSQPGDEKLAVMFRDIGVKNEARSALEGRPCYDNVTHCEIRAPASRNTHGVPYPATSRSHWATNDMTGEQYEVNYIERFPRQYEQFKTHQQQTMHGTPLDYAPWLREGRRAELRAVAVFTIEQLAALDGQELKNIGIHGREDKNRAIEYLETAKSRSVDTRLMATLEAMQAKMAALEQDNATLKVAVMSKSGEAQFADMTDEQLVEYIAANAGGHAPQGDLPRKSLLRMAIELTPSQAAA